MLYHHINIKKITQLPMILVAVATLVSCGSYNNSSHQKDGIYANQDRDYKNEPSQATTKGDHYYENYFAEQNEKISQAQQYNDETAVFTDVDSYSSNDNNTNQQNVNQEGELL